MARDRNPHALCTALLPATSSLSAIAHAQGGFSLLSYNVLRPNSIDGWWV